MEQEGRDNTPIVDRATAAVTGAAVPHGMRMVGFPGLRIAAALGTAGMIAALGIAAIVEKDGLVPGLVAAACSAVAAWSLAGLRAGRRTRDLATLAAENAELSRALEAAADRSWEREESEARFRNLVDARERAEAANRAKSRFLATVSHEFRTPLNGILGLNRLLLETGLTPAQETYARGVQSSGSALLTLIEDMLDFSKIEAGRLDMRVEPTDVAAVVTEVADLLAPKAYRKGIDIAVDIDPDRPDRVTLDPTRLRQILVNLVGNAVKFTECGGVAVSVSATRRQGGSRTRLAFAVADSGPGIAEADAERLFGEFEQADSAITRRHGGTGLGLAISRRLVGAMGGVLTVAPHTPKGSVVRFAFDADASRELRFVTSPDLAGLRLLIAMPEGAEPPALAATLARAGADVRVVTTLTAAAALAGAAAAADLPYHALLLDRRLDAGSPPAPARLREAAGTGIPVVALVEIGERTEVTRLGEEGFDACLVRPVRGDSLLAIVAGVARAPGAFRADPRERDKPAAATYHPASRSGRILLAEDNEISALLARAVFESLGHVVTEVHDGNAAVAAAGDTGLDFDAIFLDLHMPGLDGLAAAARIRADERTAGRPPRPIIALTADTLPETRRAALAAGIDSLIEKPVAPDTLRIAIDAATDRRAAA